MRAEWHLHKQYPVIARRVAAWQSIEQQIEDIFIKMGALLNRLKSRTQK